MTTSMTGRLGGACAAAAVLALAACGGGTDTASPDTQSAATDSGAQAHDASTQTFGFLRRIEKFTIKTLGNRADVPAGGDVGHGAVLRLDPLPVAAPQDVMSFLHPCRDESPPQPL